MSKHKLASCYLRGCRHLGLFTTCPCENRFRFVKGEQMCKRIGKRSEMLTVLHALVEQSRQLAATRRQAYYVDAGLDRSTWAEYRALPPALTRALTRFAADKLAAQYKLAGEPGCNSGLDASDGCADGTAANNPPYLWREVHPTDIPGVEASDAKQAWVLKRAGTRQARGRVVLLTERGVARCTCPHHEYWGLPCRHVLFLFGPPTLEMCDSMWWQSTVLGKLDDWLWDTHYMKCARMPGVLVGGASATPPSHQPATRLDIPTVCVASTFLKAEWSPTDAGAAGPVDAECSTVAPSTVVNLVGGVSSKKGYALRQDFVATFCGAWDEAIAEGKQEEVEQASNEFIAVLHAMLEGRPSGAGIVSFDGRPVSMGGAARSAQSRRGPNTSSVNAPGYDLTHGSSNPGSGKRRFSDGNEEARTVLDATPTQRQHGVPSTRGACQGGDGLGGGVGVALGDFLNWDGSFGS